MYIVDDAIVVKFLQMVPSNELKVRARLSPSMRVTEIDQYSDNITVTADIRVREAAAKISGQAIDTDLTEHYTHNRKESPVVTMEKGFIVVYYPYILIKEDT